MDNLLFSVRSIFHKSCILPVALSLIAIQLSGQPLVNSDRTVTFRVFAPDADSVKIEGDMIMELTGNYDFTNNSVPLSKGTDGVWTIKLGPLDYEPYLYNISIDGRSGPDPSNSRIFAGQRYRKSILTLNTPDTSALWETRNCLHGTVHRHTYYSPVARAMSELFVYTPPGYEESDAEYPVLYLLHGRGEKADSWLQAGFADKIADNLIAEGRCRKSVIVMPFGWVVPAGTPEKEIANRLMPNFEKELFTCIIPLIERSYRVFRDPFNNAIAGFSLGGAQTAYIGLNHPEKFSNVAVFSAGLPGFADEYMNFLANPAETNKKYRMLLFCSGSSDNIGPGGSSIEGQSKLHEILNLKGIRHSFYEMPGGGHTWKAWRYYLGEKLLPLVFKQ